MHSEPPNDDDHCCDSHLIFRAAKLDVYRHERLGYTEPPRRNSKPQRELNRAVILKEMAMWALAHA